MKTHLKQMQPKHTAHDNFVQAVVCKIGTREVVDRRAEILLPHNFKF